MFTVSDFSFRSFTKVVLHFSIVFPTHSIPPQDETSVQNWVSWGSGSASSPNGALKFRDWILATDFLEILIDRFCTSAQYITDIATSYNEKTVYIYIYMVNGLEELIEKWNWDYHRSDVQNITQSTKLPKKYVDILTSITANFKHDFLSTSVDSSST